MSQKIMFLCQECKLEWEVNITAQPIACKSCGSSKIYRSYHHQRSAKKSRSKERWSYRVK